MVRDIKVCIPSVCDSHFVCPPTYRMFVPHVVMEDMVDMVEMGNKMNQEKCIGQQKYSATKFCFQPEKDEESGDKERKFAFYPYMVQTDTERVEVSIQPINGLGRKRETVRKFESNTLVWSRLGQREWRLVRVDSFNPTNIWSRDREWWLESLIPTTI